MGSMLNLFQNLKEKFYHAALLTTFNIQTFPFLAACNVNCSVARVTAHKTIGISHVLPSAGQKTAVRQPSSASAWHRSIENLFGNLVNIHYTVLYDINIVYRDGYSVYHPCKIAMVSLFFFYFEYVRVSYVYNLPTYFTLNERKMQNMQKVNVYFYFIFASLLCHCRSALYVQR